MRMDIRCTFKGVLMPESEELPARSNTIHRNPLLRILLRTTHSARTNRQRIVYANRPLFACCFPLLVVCSARLLVIYSV